MEPQWERLAEAVRNRRAIRGWSQAAVTERGGPSDTLQNRIEAGKWQPVRGVEESLRKIDAGLEWAPGSASRILAGGEPIEIGEESTWPTEEESRRFLQAAERVNSGKHSREDDRVIREFLARDRQSIETNPGPDLADLVRSTTATFRATNDQLFKVINHPATTEGDRIELLENAVSHANLFTDFLIMAAYESSDTRARDALGEVFEWRTKMFRLLEKLQQEKEAKEAGGVTSLAGRRAVEAPPLGGLDVAASHREKQSDHDDESIDHSETSEADLIASLRRETSAEALGVDDTDDRGEQRG